MTDPPPTIYLQWYGDGDGDPADAGEVHTPEVSWNVDRVFDGDVEYMRADRVAELEDENRNQADFITHAMEFINETNAHGSNLNDLLLTVRSCIDDRITHGDKAVILDCSDAMALLKEIDRLGDLYQKERDDFEMHLERLDFILPEHDGDLCEQVIEQRTKDVVAKLTQLQSVVDRLYKTADGVVVLLGETVFYVHHSTACSKPKILKCTVLDLTPYYRRMRYRESRPRRRLVGVDGPRALLHPRSRRACDGGWGMKTTQGIDTNDAVEQFPLVVVNWDDSRGVGESWRHLSTLDEDTCYVSSVGWLIKADEGHIAIAPHVADDDPNTQVCGDMVIPRSAIIHMYQLDLTGRLTGKYEGISEMLGEGGGG